MKSEYSYLQYHWWPMVFRVSVGALTSSMRYKRRREGRARNRRVMAGRIVHTVSIAWASKVYRLVKEFRHKEMRA